jgi:hypothetical protein
MLVIEDIDRSFESVEDDEVISMPFFTWMSEFEYDIYKEWGISRVAN